MRKRTLTSVVSTIALLMATGCTAPSRLPSMPFRPLGTVTGTQSTYAYNSGLFTYNTISTVRWNSDTSNGAYTAGDGNTITFNFWGSGLHLYGSLQARGCPSIPVTVDGTGYTMSCYLSTGNKLFPQFDQTLLDIPTLPLTNHTVTITNPTRGKYVYFTRAVIDLPPPVTVNANVTAGAPYAGPPVWGP